MRRGRGTEVGGCRLAGLALALCGALAPAVADASLVSRGGGAAYYDPELNLTWLADLPAHNPLLAGSWPPKVGEVSMDQGIAGRLKIKLGDTLTFSGDTQSFSAKVTSLRQVDWESLKPNFYFIFPPGALDGQPQTWLLGA